MKIKCPHCKNTGWFYDGDSDPGAFCLCQYGKVRAEASQTRIDEIEELEGEKRILIGVIEFAINLDDHFDRLQFLKDWFEGAADVDEEWKDWQEYKKTLNQHGEANSDA